MKPYTHPQPPTRVKPPSEAQLNRQRIRAQRRKGLTTTRALNRAQDARDLIAANEKRILAGKPAALSGAYLDLARAKMDVMRLSEEAI